MKGWRLRLLIALAGLCACCAHTPSTGDGGTSPTTAFGHCTSDALAKAGQGLLGRVMTALATGDYVNQIAALATSFGADEVGCAVDLAIAELTGQHAASPDKQVSVMLTRARAWRGSHP